MHTALLLDDETNLLHVFTLYLERCGYAVLTSASCESAVQQFQRCNGAVDLLIADVVMPVRSGVEVAVQLAQSCPGLRIILMSGYPVEGWSESDRALLEQLRPDSVRVLVKPFSPTTLLHLLAELMGIARSLASSGLTRPRP